MLLSQRLPRLWESMYENATVQRFHWIVWITLKLRQEFRQGRVPGKRHFLRKSLLLASSTFKSPSCLLWAWPPISHRASLVFKEVTSSSQPGICSLLVSTPSSRTTQALRLFTTFTSHPTSTHSAFPACSDSENLSSLCSWTPVY